MYNNELYHFGVKGMKWGVRRYETKSGHLTPAGKQRYSDNKKPTKKDYYNKYGKAEVKTEVKTMRKERIAPNNHPVAKAIVRNALPMIASTYISAYGMAKDNTAVKLVGDVAGWAVLANGIRETNKFKTQNAESAVKRIQKRK